MENKMLIPFTRELQNFLARRDFTHLYNQGVASDTKPIKDDEDINYILIPLKAGNPCFKDKSKSIKIERIKSSDAIDMADGDPFTRFVIEVPIEDLEEYLKL